MNRRLGTVAIVLVALSALAAVLSFVFFSQPVPKDSAITAPTASEDSSLSSSSSSSEKINPDPSEPLPVPNSLPLVVAAPRADQPANLKPQPPSRSPDWKLLDWSLKPLPEKPGIQLRAASYLAAGKYPFVRVEQEIQILPNGDAKVLKTVEMVGDQIIVKLPDGSSTEEINSLATRLGGQAAAKPFAPDTWLVALPRKLEAVPEALTGSTNSGISIDYAEPNHLVRPMATPNDPNFTNGNQWHLNNSVQLGKDIKAPTAWDSRTDAAGVIVAVIDTGVRYTHEDLAGNMWQNPGEIAGNGIDDDRNGYIDDLHGVDEFANDGNPMDENGHGTHCAGLVGAIGNNGKGVSGVAWSGVRIMALRFIGETGSIADNVRCIDYAIAKGAKVLNASYGSPSASNIGSSSEAAAIYRAQQAGVIMVAAVGNGGEDLIGDNNDTTPFYPASYTEYVERSFPRRAFALNNIIAVGATDRNDTRAGFSNFGATSVDLMAPGVSMWSTTSGSDSSYGAGQGTSFAAPVVAGGLALLRASYPSDSVSQLRTKILAGVDAVPVLSGLCVTGGRMNLAKLIPTVVPSTLATAWHRPAFPEPLLSSNTMRLPAYEVAQGNPFTVYSGIRKLNNPGFGTANQTGGHLFYRTSATTAWTSNALVFDSNSGDYQFWKAVVPGTATTNLVQYYLRLTFDSGVAPVCYLYGSDNQSTVTTDESAAQAQPFSLRDRVSWVYHVAGDRTLSTNTATIRAKVGYIAPDGISYQGATAGALYYTLDGNFPVGSMGNPGNGSTLTVPFQYLFAQSDPSQAGEAMIWEAVLTNLPVGVPIHYVLGFWNENTMEEQRSGYQSAGSLTQGEFQIPWSFSAVYPASLPTSDANGDGVPALVEYALGGSSQSNNLGILPSVTLSNNILKLKALVRTNDTNLLVYPEATLNLGASTSWTAFGFTTNLPDQTGVPPGFQRREYQFNAGTNPRAFLKLTIQQQ
jgi:subtilisin family serine protease